MANPVLDFRTTNTLWASVLAETLACGGVRLAVISPGSRSTPLALALARHPQIEVVSILDERSAGFFALGWSKRAHAPAVLLCTSGSAGAHYLPALIEARESEVPLLVLTADRPPELRDCASGQTIDQQKLFGGYVVFFHELAVPEPRLELLRYLRQTVTHALARTATGPVHLNLPFRDPLVPGPGMDNASLATSVGTTAPAAPSSLAALAPYLGEEFFSHLTPRPKPAPSYSTAPFSSAGGGPWGGESAGAAAAASTFSAVSLIPAVTYWQRPTTTRGLIYAGPASPADPAAYARKLHLLAAGLGWPVLADALSPLRHYAAPGEGLGRPVIATYDAILRNEALARSLAPRTVLCLEGWPASKVLRGWLEASGAEIVLVAATAANRDGLHGRTRHLQAAPEQLAVVGARVDDDSYARAWQAADAQAAAALVAGVQAEAGWVEPQVTLTLAQVLPPDHALLVANSMPVRDLEYFWPAGDRRHRVYFNRGANGIDGTLSTALGLAHGGTPVVLLTGDLSFLHDTNGLLTAGKLRGSLTILLINNHGGGIFEHLPIAQIDPPFEALWATPQQVDFAQLCAAYQVEYARLAEAKELARRLAVGTSPALGVRVWEIVTERKRDAALRKRLFAQVARSLY